MSNPSLILPQSPAYGEDYVYAAQVEDGAVPLYNVLPLTFARASGGTRINKDGLVQNMPYNLLSYSEDFTNGVWALSNVTITTNAIANPINGQTNAELATCASGSSISPNIYYQTSFAATNGQVYNYSYYAKKGGSNFAKIRFSGSAFASVTNTPIFNLNTGVVVSGTGTIESVGNGWYRISASATAEANASAVVTIDIPSSTGVWPNGNFTGAESIYIFGAQVNIGSTAQPYLATTDRLNMPRITYPVGGGCGALLLEKQSTNINTYSEDFSNAVYTKEYGTITTNQTTSPDGTSNADKFTDNSTNNYHIFYPGSLTITTSRVSSSVYVKNNDIQFCAFQLATTIGGTYDTRFTLIVDLINGTITDTEQVGTPNAVYSIQNVGNGWYRLLLTCDHSAGSVAWVVGGSNSGTPSTFVAALPTYIGTGKSLFIWGAQLEASSYATSYIPTTSTSATRIADACYKTGISNLFGTNQGTFFIDFVFYGSEQFSYIFDVTDSANSNRFLMYDTTGAGLYALYDSAAGAWTTTQLNKGQRYKIAVKYNSSATFWFINGVYVGNNGGFAFANQMSQIYLGIRYSLSDNTGMQVNSTQIYNTALTNSELISLTTL